MENQPNQMPSSAPTGYGEMSLSDIVDSLQRGKKLIAVCAILGGIIAALFLIQKRVFMAEAHFLPPSSAEVEPLNVRLVSIPISNPGTPLKSTGGRGELLSNFTPGEVYGQFLLTVQSHSLHRRVLEEQGVLEPVRSDMSIEERAKLDESFQEWESNFSLNSDSSDSDVVGFVRISQKGKDPEQVAAFLNQVAELAAQRVHDDLKRVVLTRVADRRSEVVLTLANERARAASTRADEISRMEEEQAIEAGQLRGLIDIRQNQLDARNADQVVRLKEALAIAEAAGLENPLPGLGGTTSLVSFDYSSVEEEGLASSIGERQQSRVDFNATPLFFRGSKMLKAELAALESRVSSDPYVEDLRLLQEQLQQVLANPKLEALRNRASDDPFIVGLRQLEVEDRALAGIELPDEGLAAMTFDQRALPPVSPMTGWSFVLPGVLLGLAIGVIWALLRRVLTLQRKASSGL